MPLAIAGIDVSVEEVDRLSGKRVRTMLMSSFSTLRIWAGSSIDMRQMNAAGFVTVPKTYATKPDPCRPPSPARTVIYNGTGHTMPDNVLYHAWFERSVASMQARSRSRPTRDPRLVVAGSSLRFQPITTRTVGYPRNSHSAAPVARVSPHSRGGERPDAYKRSPTREYINQTCGAHRH